MYQHSRVGQGIGRFLHIKLGPAYFHSGALGSIKNLGRFVDAGYQLIDPPAHQAGRDEALVPGRMASDADRLFAGADHFIPGLGDEMIAVALDALAELTLVKGGFVRTYLEQFSLSPMARSADVRDRSDAWRRRAMIAMTIVTGRRGQILLHIDRVGMNTLFIFVELIAWNSESAHVVRASMTLCAGLSNV